MEGYESGFKVQGSMTVEMSFLMPMILFLIMECILAVFYYHDKNILSGAAYETAVAGSTKSREKDGVKEGELEALFYQRAGNKCILFVRPQATVTVKEDEIEVRASASRKYLRISIIKKAAVTKPEEYIRNLRRLKGLQTRMGERGKRQLFLTLRRRKELQTRMGERGRRSGT